MDGASYAHQRLGIKCDLGWRKHLELFWEPECVNYCLGGPRACEMKTDESRIVILCIHEETCHRLLELPILIIEIRNPGPPVSNCVVLPVSKPL